MTNEELLAAINARFDAIQERIDSVEERLSGQIEDLREECEITRDGVNSLLDWAEHAGKVINFPIAN